MSWIAIALSTDRVHNNMQTAIGLNCPHAQLGNLQCLLVGAVAASWRHSLDRVVEGG
jgi:hypothetical protein